MSSDINDRRASTSRPHLVRASLFMALLLSISGPAFSQEAPAPDDTAKPKPAEAKPAPANQQEQPLLLKAIPHSLQTNSSVNCNENGISAGQNSYFSINF